MKNQTQRLANEHRANQLAVLLRSGQRWVRPSKNRLQDIRVQITGLLNPKVRTWPAWKILGHKQP